MEELKKTKEGKKESHEIKIIKKLLESKLLYVIAGISFVLFLLTRSYIFSGLAVIIIFLLLLLETVAGASEHGMKKEIYEIGIAIATALVVWFGLSFMLSTSAPLNAVVSCSMLPNLERGDLVVLQGAEPKGVDVYVDKFDPTDISVLVQGAQEAKLGFSLARYCAFYSDQQICKTYVTSPEKITEKYGPLEIKHGVCKVSSAGKEYQIPCATSIVVDGKEYKYDHSGETIVYTTLPLDAFSGSGGAKEIIHRVFMKVHAGEKEYYITKGDNNDRFDIQYDNSPPTKDRVSGKVIVRLPYLGYFKLFLFGFFSDPAGCDRTLQLSAN
jgi:signal peptidase I